MRILYSVSVFLICSLALASTPYADEYKQCGAEFDRCLKACDDEFGNDTSGRAACVPTCSAKYAACDAGVAYDKAKPWVEEQAGKTKKFFDDLMDRLKKEPSEPESAPAEPNAPTDKSI